MDKGFSKVSKRGLTVTLMAMLCVAAILALPAFAFAANSPVDGSTVTNATVRITWDASALTGTLRNPVMTVNGTPVPAFVSGTNVYCTAKLSDGAYSVTASVRDGNGAVQTAATPWGFTVSEAPKFATPLIPGNGQKLTAAPAAISFKATDNKAVTVADVTVNGVAGTATYNAGTGRYDVTGGAAADEAYNTVVATVQDAAGNSTVKTWGFFVSAATATAACTKCHSGSDIGLSPSMNAGGHNTTENGIVGARTKFDGSQGVTLRWKATQDFTVTTAKFADATDPGAAVAAAPGASFTNGQTGVMTSTWATPTVSVFWPAVNDGVQDAPATAMKGLGWDSVITCENCHTGFTATGPHGATANGGLDPNYPADYSMAMLSKKVTSGSAFTTGGDYTPSGIAVGTSPTSAPAPGNAGSNFFASNLKNGTSGAYAVICAKCHRLETVIAANAWAQNGTTMPYPAVVGANTPHNSHHQDTSDGTAQCVSCHVAIPHGWKAPRLLVDVPKYEGTPFVSEKAVEEMGTIAGLNNHPRIPDTGVATYDRGSGAVNTTSDTSLVGTVVWDESQCDACGDHYGNDTLHPGTNWTPDATHQTAAVPVRIDF